MKTAECPLCGDRLDMEGECKLGQSLLCPLCEAMLEVVCLKPFKLEWIYFDENKSEDRIHKKSKIRKTKCEFCQYEFNAPRNLRLGQCVLCPSCDVELEVVWLKPVKLGWPYGEIYHQQRDGEM